MDPNAFDLLYSQHVVLHIKYNGCQLVMLYALLRALCSILSVVLGGTSLKAEGLVGAYQLNKLSMGVVVRCYQHLLASYTAIYNLHIKTMVLFQLQKNAGLKTKMHDIDEELGGLSDYEFGELLIREEFLITCWNATQVYSRQ